jgi:hypothetical protein
MATPRRKNSIIQMLLEKMFSSEVNLIPDSYTEANTTYDDTNQNTDLLEWLEERRLHKSVVVDFSLQTVCTELLVDSPNIQP